MILPTTWSLLPLSSVSHGRDRDEDCGEKASSTLCARSRASGIFIDRTTSSPLSIYQQNPHTFQGRKKGSVLADAADATNAARPTSCVTAHKVRNTRHRKLANILESTAIPVPKKRRVSIRSCSQNTKKHRSPLCYNPFPLDDVLVSDDSSCDSSDSLTSRDSTRSRLGSLLSSSCQSNDDLSTSLSSGTGLFESSLGGTCQAWSKEYDDLCQETSLHRLITQYSKRRRHVRVPSKREDCTQDHPLLYGPSDASPSHGDDNHPSSGPSSLSFSTPISLQTIGAAFRSNLKASIRMLKSTSQSVSNFTAPAARSGDYLAQSFFSNTTKPTSGQKHVAVLPIDSLALLELHAGSLNMFFEHTREVTSRMDTKNASSDSAKKERNRAPVPMTTYYQLPSAARLQRSLSRTSNSSSTSSSSSSASSSPPSSPHSKSPAPRSRDIRANSDFLRVIVLEMEMRRCGKLRFDVPGRARLFLPPRKSIPVQSNACSSSLQASKIPQRWVSVTPDTV